MMEKNLRLNEDKCVVITIGTKNIERKQRFSWKQIQLCVENLRWNKLRKKWLGQQISAGGLAESVAETVAAKEGKIKAACIEVANIVNDWRTEIVGGLETAMISWEACIIPSLLHSCSTWTQISRATENRLNNLQRWFVRLILQVPQSTPAPALTWETGLIDMRLRIWKEKLMLILHISGLNQTSFLHIRSLEGTALANKIYNEQRKEGWPGLAKETKEICKELNIMDVNTTYLTKN